MATVISIIVKVTENCNADCVYCSVEGKDRRRSFMSDETLELFTRRLADYLNADPERKATIIWHGGEPMLMGKNFYEKVLALQQTASGGVCGRIKNRMQSNIILYNDSMKDVLEKLGIEQIGTSYEYVDGLRRLGGSKSSEMYNTKFFEAARRLKRLRADLGVIYVVTSKSIDKPVETVNFLSNLSLFGNNTAFRINPIYREGEAKKSELSYLFVTAEQYGHFLGRAFAHLYNRRHSFPKIAPFDSMLRKLTDPFSILTCDESGVCGRTHMGIDSEGNIYQCGRAMDAGVFKYGNLKENDFENVFDNSLKNSIDKRVSVLASGHCAKCRFFDLCHGGCPVDSINYYNDINHPTFFCESRRIFFERYFEPVTGYKIERSVT
ncbi:MAG: radical SAM protein [Spirochaetia bacterium]|nr:radical SAM protein [Spirochaetia bacterium]